MFRNANDLRTFKLGARDGAIGKVKDLFFDDVNWTVRYLVADTGNWLAGRRVLISPHSIRRIDDESKLIDVDQTKSQIENAPSVEHDQPVSRQMEEQFFQYYNWPYYWIGPYTWGPYPVPGIFALQAPSSVETNRFQPPAGNPHLRSADEVRNYRIQALDDHFGHVEDFVFERENWTIRYIIVDTRNWWPGKKVLVPTEWISSIDWTERLVRIDLDRESVRRAPEYNPNEPITREYEAKLFSFFAREPYWSDRHLHV